MDTFADSLPELFAGQELGEDALRILHESLKLNTRTLADIAAELHHFRIALKWASQLARHIFYS